MPRANRFFNNLSDTPILSDREAVDVLDEYCDENNISLNQLPNRAINDFIETIQYAPAEISTREIANATGIRADNYIASHRHIPDSATPRRLVQSRNSGNHSHGSEGLIGNSGIRYVSSNAPSSQAQIDAYQELVNTMISQPTITLDSVGTLQSSPMLDNILAERSIENADSYYLNYSPTFSNRKVKKRTRSEMEMMKEIVRSDRFPRPNFKDFSSKQEFSEIMDNWYSNVEYREHWIFSRREREGFNRRNIGQFSLDDVMARISKRRKPHALDSQFSKFYDWKLGGTDWVLRLELFQHEQYYFLITRHIHKPTDIEIKFDVRYWSDNNKKFKAINSIWSDCKNTVDRFEKVFGSLDENSPYYVAPYEQDEEDEDYEDYEEEPSDFEDIGWDEE